MKISNQYNIVLNEPWGNLIKDFILNLDRKENTKLTYQKSLKEWVKFLDIENKNPDINLILQYKNYLIDRKLSPYTVSVYLTALKVFFDYLVSIQKIPYNPAKSIKGMKKPKSRRGTLIKEEVLQLLSLENGNNLEDYRNKAILTLKLFTGLRDISIVGANVGDLRVKDDRHILYYQTKGADIKDDFVILESDVYYLINLYLIKRGDFKDDDPLFVSCSDRNRSSRLTTQSIRLIIRGFFNKAGIIRKEITPHSLRHTAITFAILGGASVTQAKEMASHSSIETTAGYFHDINRLKNPAELFIKKYLCINDNSI